MIDTIEVPDANCMSKKKARYYSVFVVYRAFAKDCYLAFFNDCLGGAHYCNDDSAAGILKFVQTLQRILFFR